MTKFRGVEGGTPTGTPLCRTCNHATYIRGKAEGQELLLCGMLAETNPHMPWEAYECGSYSDKRQPSVYEMKQVAWIIRSDTHKKTVGFVAPGTTEHEKLANQHLSERVR